MIVREGQIKVVRDWSLTNDVTYVVIFFFNDTATTEIYTLSLHDALPICNGCPAGKNSVATMYVVPQLIGASAVRQTSNKRDVDLAIIYLDFKILDTEKLSTYISTSRYLSSRHFKMS